MDDAGKLTDHLDDEICQMALPDQPGPTPPVPLAPAAAEEAVTAGATVPGGSGEEGCSGGSGLGDPLPSPCDSEGTSRGGPTLRRSPPPPLAAADGPQAAAQQVEHGEAVLVKTEAAASDDAAATTEGVASPVQDAALEAMKTDEESASGAEPALVAESVPHPVAWKTDDLCG